VKHAHAERERVSAFAPINARGTRFYDAFVAAMREHLVMSGCGWTMRCINGLEVVEHKEKRIRIAYLSVSGTSGEHMTSSPRGPVSITAAATNQQLLLLAAPWLEPTKTLAAKVRRLKSAFETWFLGIEFIVDRYQIVLALPKEPENEGVRFVDWENCIRAADVPIDSEPKDDALPPPPPAETVAPPKVTRKIKWKRKKPDNDTDTSTTGTG
jgi:hypothetical protein